MLYYAQLDDLNYCIGVSQVAGNLSNDNMIEIESYDPSLLDRKYDSVNETWLDEYRVIEEPNHSDELYLETAVKDLQEENAGILLDSVMKDIEIQQLKADFANLTLEVALNGLV